MVVDLDFIYRARVQWLEWIFSFFCLASIFFSPLRTLFEEKLKQNSKAWVTGLLLSFFALAYLTKLSQFFCLTLRASDHWLFVDLVNNMKSGHFFLTRFAPHEAGLIQHGAVHPYHWIFFPILPLTYLFDTNLILLLWNPFVLTFSGFCLWRLLSTLKIQSPSSVLILASFQFSSLVTLINSADIHPEGLYPAFVFLLLRALLKKQFLYSCIVVFLIGNFKMDSILIFSPILLSLWMLKKIDFKLFVAVELVGIFGFLLGLITLKLFQAGLMGSTTLGSLHAIIPSNPMPFIKGSQSNDGVYAVVRIFFSLIHENGGVLGAFKSFFAFIQGTFLDFLRYAPWNLVYFPFWVSMLPYSFVYSLRGNSAILSDYYSAPFVALLWQAIAMNPITNMSRVPWILLFLSLTHGIISFEILVPKSNLLELRQCAVNASAMIPSHFSNGLVSSSLIQFVPLQQIYSHRVLEYSNISEAVPVSFIFSQKAMNIAGLNPDSSRDLYMKIKEDSQWEMISDQRLCFLAFKKENKQ